MVVDETLDAGNQASAAPVAAPRKPLWRRPGFIVTVLLVAGAVLWWTEGNGRRMFFARNWGVVDEGHVYRSGQLHRFLLERTLKEHGIDVVIDLARDNPDDEDAAAERRIVKDLGLTFVQLDTLDGSGRGDPEDYVKAMGALLDARAEGKQVLLHCAAGSERTGALVAMYRMLYQDWDGDRAYEEYLSYRHRLPDEPKLSRWMTENLPTVMRRLQEEGRLDPAHGPPPKFGPAAGP